MSKCDVATKRTYADKNNPKPKEKYKTDLLSRARVKENLKVSYNTTPVDKFSARNLYENDNQLRNKNNLRYGDQKRQREATYKTYFPQFENEEHISQFDYLRNNLYIKTCLGNCDVLKCQMKKITFRNYTPKILNQEVNMGMWI